MNAKKRRRIAACMKELDESYHEAHNLPEEAHHDVEYFDAALKKCIELDRVISPPARRRRRSTTRKR